MALNNYDNDQFDRDYYADDHPGRRERRRGRGTFLALILILGLIFLIALLWLLWFAPGFIANQNDDDLDDAAIINAANTATALAINSDIDQQHTQLALTLQALDPTTAPTSTPVAEALANDPASPTPGQSSGVIADAPEVKPDVVQVNVQAPAELPRAGFADGFNLPVLGGLTLLFVAIIALSRKLRASSR